jgi:DNA-binding response OmpR family regulator
MFSGSSLAAHIVLTGLELPAQQDLSRVLREQGHRVSTGWRGALATADALFCSGDDPSCRALVCQVRKLRPSLPVIVVTRLPESRKWLDALEAGAADYCSAPFDAVQIGWLLAAVLAHAAAPGAPGERNQVPAGASNPLVLV